MYRVGTDNEGGALVYPPNKQTAFKQGEGGTHELHSRSRTLAPLLLPGRNTSGIYQDTACTNSEAPRGAERVA